MKKTASIVPANRTTINSPSVIGEAINPIIIDNLPILKQIAYVFCAELLTVEQARFVYNIGETNLRNYLNANPELVLYNGTKILIKRSKLTEALLKASSI